MPELPDVAVFKYFKTMRRVLKKAIEKDADPKSMPRTWLLPRRDQGGPCPRCDGTIERIIVAQRGTHYCPKCQKAPS